MPTFWIKKFKHFDDTPPASDDQAMPGAAASRLPGPAH
jgi:hypothetical protein